MSYNITRGREGEYIAKKYLTSKGYVILETNYRNHIGEIDVIALDHDILVFVEVKTRTSVKYGYAFEAVDYRKQKKIINTSLVYIKYKKYLDTQIRYDIIEIYLTENPKINHLENAFESLI